MHPLCFLRAERQWLCKNIQLPAASNGTNFIVLLCRVWGWVYLLLSRRRKK